MRLIQSNATYGVDYTFFETQVCSSVWGIKLTDTIIPPPPPPLDNIVPVVSISSPLDGFVVPKQDGKNVFITATATDNVGVTGMQVFVDGALKFTNTLPSISYTWSAKSATSGNHIVRVDAKDMASNIGSKSVTIKK